MQNCERSQKRYSTNHRINPKDDIPNHSHGCCDLKFHLFWFHDQLSTHTYELDWIIFILTIICSTVEIEFRMDIEDEYYKMYQQKFSKVTLS